MDWGGIIAGAIGGASNAAGQIADRNIKLRDEEEHFARQQAATRANADYSHKLSLDRFNAEADRRLSDVPKAAAAKIEEEKKGRLGRVEEIETEQRGLIQQAIAKKASAARGSAVAYEDLTPEEISKLGLTEGETSKLRTQAARNVGLISEKDMMTSEQRAEMAQLRADVANAKTEAQREAAQARLEQQKVLFEARLAAKGAGGGKSEKDTRMQTLTQARNTLKDESDTANKAITELNKERKESPWLAEPLDKQRPGRVEEARRWQNARDEAQAVLDQNKVARQRLAERLDDLFDDQTEKRGGTPRRTEKADNPASQKSAGAISKLPPGSVQIGTSNGKPVYKTPDGKQFLGQ